MTNGLITAWLVLFSFHAFAQTDSDSTVILSYQDYIITVTNNHPIARQADIKVSQADAGLMYARGAFDPKLYTNVSEKYFTEKQYYSRVNGGIKIPTWFGVELKAAYEQNGGVYLDPSNTVPDNGLLYVGISLPIGRGLLIDKRRAELKKALLFQQISEMEKQLMLNDLIYSAGLAYWKWFKAHNILLVYREGYQLAKERFDAVQLGANIGDRPSIDTLEAGIQVQNRLLGLQQSKLDFKNASALLSIYLWADGNIPLELKKETIPVVMDTVLALGADQSFFTKMDSLINNHPLLNQSRYQINQFEIDKKLKKNQLLPSLNLKYNPIREYRGQNNFSINNYTWGLDFQMPIFLRKERGSLKLTELKIQEYNLKLVNKQEILKYKLISAWNQWNTTKSQIDLYTRTLRDTRALLAGEQRLFNLGESSLFMVNSRELKYIKTQLKFIGLLSKNKNAELATKYALGGLAN